MSLQCRPEIPTFGPLGDTGQLVSAAALPDFVRVIALNSNLVSQISQATGDAMRPYESNWVSRLHHLERARAKIETQQKRQKEEREAQGFEAGATRSRYDVSRF